MLHKEIFSDKRTCERVSKTFAVTYEIMSYPFGSKKKTDQKERRIANSFNLSAGGIGLITDENLFPKQILEIEFVLEGKEKPIAAYSLVRWSNCDDKTAEYRAGTEFLAIKEKDKNFIKELVK